MDITRNIAKRYLFSKKHLSLVSVLTTVSIAGVTVGTALLIIILSIFNGFFDVVQSMLRTYDPDIRIESADAPFFHPDSALFVTLSSIPEVKSVTRYVEGKSLLVYEGHRDKVVIVKGIEAETYFPLLEKREASGVRIPSLAVSNRMPGILLGSDLRAQLSVAPGDRLALLSPEGVRRSLTQFSGPRHYTFEVRGAFELASAFDGSITFIELEAAQRLYQTRGAVSGVDIRLKNHEHADQIKQQLAGQLGDGMKISTWYDLQKNMYDIMYLEKWASYFILSIIIAVAVMNIVGSLTMIVIQKQRDIGVLMTMGFTSSQIRKVFMTQGLYIGAIGSFVGGGVGLLICYVQKTYELVKITGSSAFIIDAYPVLVSWTDVIAVLSVTMSLCLLASIYPARRASQTDPAQAVRYE